MDIGLRIGLVVDKDIIHKGCDNVKRKNVEFLIFVLGFRKRKRHPFRCLFPN
jgi:hypothetical protein